MVFYVYTDPDIISIAKDRGQDSLQILVGILRNFVDNCFLTEFEDYRIQDTISRHVENIPEKFFERKQIKSLLSTLQKRNRFIYCLAPDYSGAKSNLEIVLENATELLIDLLLLGNSEIEIDNSSDAEITDLSKYQNTNFADKRSKSMIRVFSGDEFSEQDFLDLHYKKALMYCTRLEICDTIFGRYFGDNFDYSIEFLFKWLSQIHSNTNELKIIIHCEKPNGQSDIYIKNRLERHKQQSLTNTKIEIIFYESEDGSRCLPHERFFITDQIGFDIGRGMDFLNPNTHRNRDTKVGIINPVDIEKLIEKYSDYKLATIEI